MEQELQQELLDYARRRYHAEKLELLRLLELKEKEIEDLRAAMRVMEDKIGASGAAIDQERLDRMAELSEREELVQRLYNDFRKDEDVLRQELMLKDQIIRKLNSEIGDYKEEMQKLLEENRKNIHSLQEELGHKDLEMETLKVRERELEAKILSVEAAAKEKEGKLNQKILELEQFLNQEKEARAKLEEISRTALATSTASLLEERARAEIFQNRFTTLTREVEKLEQEKNKILENWERERKKWEELWERERKVWEGQRVSMSDWEAKYQRERAQWERFLRDKEEKEVRLSRVFSTFVEELGRWANYMRSGKTPAPSAWQAPPVSPEKLGEALAEAGRAAAEPGPAAPVPAPSEGPAPMPPQFPQMDRPVAGLPEGESSFENALRLRLQERGPKTPWKRVAAWTGIAIAAALGFTGGIAAWRRHTAAKQPVVYEELGAWDLAIASPSGIAREDPSGLLWITDWKSGQIFKVARADPAKIAGRHPSSKTFFHPNAIVFDPAGEWLYTLDSVAHKIYKHKRSDPSVIVEEVPTPTASCLFLAVLEETYTVVEEAGAEKPSTLEKWRLAVLDTIQRNVYVYDPEALGEKPQILFTLPQEITPLAFCALKDSLWVLDAKTSLIRRFAKDAKSQWVKKEAIEARLAQGPQALSGASAILLTEDQSFYALLEGDPPQLILAKPKRAK